MKWAVKIGLLFIAFTHCAMGKEPSAPRLKYGEGKELAKLADRAVNESSGVAVGRVNRDVFWTHNDSGDGPRVFAFDKSGKALATLTVAGAKARDWEDMASFLVKRRGMLLMADVGDNAAKRDVYTLYAFYEPKLRGRRAVSRNVRLAKTIRFKYEDGSHNCESVAVDPTDQTIYLVSKVGGNECKVYSLAWPKRSRNKTPYVAKAIATLKVPTTTAMDISPDGLRAVVLTYGDAFEYTRSKSQTWAQGFGEPGRRLKMPPRAQGESICYGSDGKTLYLTSECKAKDSRSPSPLLEVPVLKGSADKKGSVKRAR